MASHSILAHFGIRVNAAFCRQRFSETGKQKMYIFFSVEEKKIEKYIILEYNITVVFYSFRYSRAGEKR